MTLVADLTLDKHILQKVREVDQLTKAVLAGLIGIRRGSHRYRSRKDTQMALRLRLWELAGKCVRYGYRRLTILLRRERWVVNAKRVYRLYRKQGL